MALDGLTMRALVDELSEKITGSRIDKVYQPEEDEILLNLRGKDENIKLLISASASHPRAYIAKKYEKTNPKKAPMFCMFLRKHIQAGRILSVEQIGFDRIIKIKIETLNELRERIVKDMYIEIMGRHSNIILVNSQNNLILDSIKKVSHNVSSVRQILPGLEYELPPQQNKKSIEKAVDIEFLKETVPQFNGMLFKYIYQTFEGFSPLTSKEILARAGISLSANAMLDVWDEHYEPLKNAFGEFKNIIEEKKYTPCMAIDDKKDKIIGFSAFRLTQFSDYTLVYEESVSQLLEEYYNTRDTKDRINQRTSNLRKSLTSKLERQKNKLKKINEEIEESNHAEKYKIRGELVTSYIYMIKKGMESVTVQNYYSENQEEMEIKLNPNKTPSENAQKFFKKYNKLKNAKIMLTEQKKIAQDEIDYLESTLLAIDNCENLKEFKDIKNELIKTGYIKSRRMPSRKEMATNNMPMEFLSDDGTKILVGKNNRQNDYLTLRLAEPDDTWLHTKNRPGSHVIIKSAGTEISDSTLEQAAILAAYYSSGKGQTKIEVDYTQKRNVRKPSGAKPGMVIYDNNRTIVIDATEEAAVAIRKNRVENQ